MSQHNIFQYTDPEIGRILSDTSEEYTPDTPILSGNGSFLIGEKSISIDPETRTITLDLKKAYRYIPHYEERILTDREILSHFSSVGSTDYNRQTEEIN
ncbi:hypothetical protein KBC86_05430, partial [Candidatus Gracilibacteria bacterium]|nr:hypothetical protein [Candidatus Gracilibacteria bacterium]